MRWLTIQWRAWRLLCPRCGEGKLFVGWFRMYSHCYKCRLKYNREPGYFLGSVYINYGLTALLLSILYFSMHFSGVPARLVETRFGQVNLHLTISLAFAVLFPLSFHRYARSLWMAFDQFWDPATDEQDSE
jgi:uncharacterized protein (DUF983 family)